MNVKISLLFTLGLLLISFDLLARNSQPRRDLCQEYRSSITNALERRNTMPAGALRAYQNCFGRLSARDQELERQQMSSEMRPYAINLDTRMRQRLNSDLFNTVYVGPGRPTPVSEEQTAIAANQVSQEELRATLSPPNEAEARSQGRAIAMGEQAADPSVPEVAVGENENDPLASMDIDLDNILASLPPPQDRRPNIAQEGGWQRMMYSAIRPSRDSLCLGQGPFSADSHTALTFNADSLSPEYANNYGSNPQSCYYCIENSGARLQDCNGESINPESTQASFMGYHLCCQGDQRHSEIDNADRNQQVARLLASAQVIANQESENPCNDYFQSVANQASEWVANQEDDESADLMSGQICSVARRLAYTSMETQSEQVAGNIQDCNAHRGGGPNCHNRDDDRHATAAYLAPSAVPNGSPPGGTNGVDQQ